jgi:DnaJ like chaperone protein
MYGTDVVNLKGPMNWLGKLTAALIGFFVWQLPGAALGLLLGHAIDHWLQIGGHGPISRFLRKRAQRRARSQGLFLEVAFSLMGHIAKSKGRVTRIDIAVADDIMQRMGLDGIRRDQAIRFFSAGKEQGFQCERLVDRFQREIDNPGLRRLLIETLLEIAYANGRISSCESRILTRLRDRMRFDRAEFDRLESLVRAERRFADDRENRKRGGEKGSASGRAGQKGGAGARSGKEQQGRGAGRQQRGTIPPSGPPGAIYYATLGLTPNATNKEIERAYRRLLSQNHPDKVMARGLPEAQVKAAAQRTHEIRTAYDKLRRLRRF